MPHHRSVLAPLVLLIAAACAASPTDPATAGATPGAGSGGTGGTSGSAALARVRCEVRSGRSKASVDGNNLRPLGGTFSARLTSGASTAIAPAGQAVGDEVEFDFDSAPEDIVAGATAIPADFISRTAGAGVTGEILDASGQVVASATAACQVR